MSTHAASPGVAPGLAAQQGPATALVLHIAPELLVTAGFLILKPLADAVGFPPLLAFLVAVLLLDIPAMLGVMLREGKRRNGRLSLVGVLGYRETLPWTTFALVGVRAFVVVALLVTVVTPIGNVLSETVFTGLPEWFFLEEQTQYEAYPRSTLIVVFALQLVITGVALPWVEELYFRGYLLPRLSRHGAWAPLLGGLGLGSTTSGSSMGLSPSLCWARRWRTWSGGSGICG